MQSVGAQIIELNKLSTGRFYHSEEIKDNKNNIKGYFLLFESDKIQKEKFLLEYIVLDENLTKVTNGFIEEMKYSSFLLKSDRITFDITLFNNKLLIELNDDTENGKFFRRYRTLDLSNNKMSDIFIFRNGKVEVKPEFDRKLKNFDANQTDEIIGINEVGLIAIKEDKDQTGKEKSLFCLDDNFNNKWKTTYETSKNDHGFKELKFLNASKEYVLFSNHYTKSGYYKPVNSVLCFNNATGKQNFEYLFSNQDKYTYKVVDSYMQNDELTLLGNYSKRSDYGFIRDEENLGIFKIKLSLENGKKLEEKFLNWTELSPKVDIDKYGEIKKEGNIFVHDLIQLSNGKIIAVCEAFKRKPVTTNNIYFLEISAKFTFDKILIAEKFRNKFPGTEAPSRVIKEAGGFDYMDFQDLDDDEFLFYFSDNEKNSKNRNQNTKFGIVSYSNNEFIKKQLDLKTNTSKIFAFPGKKGYMMLIEFFDSNKKSSEIRLEKVNM
ncbi:hypothetical protein GCM10023230_06340 [Flavobacterium hankyongi]|uniref:Uncharacterized protein n=2 Tax=Flavobacteriaceae TaxID=49546 RepID=A0ABP8ZMA8_9FLAO